LKIKFIINPVAGKGRSLKAQKIIVQRLKNLNITFSIQQTTAQGDALKIAGEAAVEGYDTVVAVGGDGTIYEVINAIAKTNIKLGIIPTGTGNDFAKSVGIPENIELALNIILNQSIKKIDIGCVNGKYFINVASIGFDTEVVNGMKHIKRFISGPWAYILSVFKTLISYRDITVEFQLDNKLMKKEVLLVAIANGKYYGGGMMIAPNARIDDGYLDICVINKISKLKFIKLFPTIFKGKHISLPEVECFKAKQVKILTNNQIINCDGELIGYTPIAFNISEYKLNLLVAQQIKKPFRKDAVLHSLYNEQQLCGQTIEY
jgi:YegS/Rv2252/BmrU family lipid kinase